MSPSSRRASWCPCIRRARPTPATRLPIKGGADKLHCASAPEPYRRPRRSLPGLTDDGPVQGRIPDVVRECFGGADTVPRYIGSECLVLRSLCRSVFPFDACGNKAVKKSLSGLLREPHRMNDHQFAHFFDTQCCLHVAHKRALASRPGCETLRTCLFVLSKQRDECTD